MEALADKCDMRFEPAEFRRRVDLLREELRKCKVDVYVGSKPEHLNYFSGFDPSGGNYYQQLFIDVHSDRDPILLTHKVEAEIARTTCWIDDIRTWRHGEDPVGMTLAILSELSVAPSATVGFELDNSFFRIADFQQLVEALPHASIVDVTNVGMELRVVKSKAEIAYLREAAAIADVGLQAAIDRIQAGAKENEVNAAIQHAVWMAGTENAPFPTTFGSGPRSGLMHAFPTTRVMEAGDPVVVAVAGAVARYFSNVLRVVVAGKASAKVKELHEIVLESFWRGFEALQPGNPIGEADRITKEVRADYADFIPARSGFGVGLAYPPPEVYPSILAGDPHVLLPGMVLSLEPSIAQYDGMTLILGNNVLITDSGPEILNGIPDRIFESG